MNKTAGALKPPRRLPTGIAGLDRVLNGGFLVHGIYQVVGSPGAGKTVLGNQLCFNHVAVGGRAVFLTLLSETSTQMFSHLHTMSFFDATRVGNTLHYFSGYAPLHKDGLEALIDLIQHIMHNQQPTLLVMDGLGSVEAVAGSEVAFMEFIQTLHAVAEAAGCTTFLLTNPKSDSHANTSATMVDGLIDLHDHQVGPRAVRTLQITKFRGSAYVRGRHVFQISDRGIIVNPRTEAILTRRPDNTPDLQNRAAFGIPELDEMLQGGLPTASTTLVFGVPGTGKTLLGTSFLTAGARLGEKGLYCGFAETPPRLLAKAAQIGLDLTQHVDDGTIALMWQSPVEDNLDALVERLLETIQRGQVRRLFIDGLEGLRAITDFPSRFERALTALSNELRALNVTMLLSVEMSRLFGHEIIMPTKSDTADNVIFLRYVELYSHLHRLISIMKIRDSAFDSAIREFNITAHGIQVAATFESAEAVLTGIARMTSASRRSPSTPRPRKRQ